MVNKTPPPKNMNEEIILGLKQFDFKLDPPFLADPIEYPCPLTPRPSPKTRLIGTAEKHTPKMVSHSITRKAS